MALPGRSLTIALTVAQDVVGIGVDDQAAGGDGDRVAPANALQVAEQQKIG